MDTKKLEIIFNNLNGVLMENEATLEDVAQLGLTLIVEAWKLDSNRENIINAYIKWFSDSLKDITSKLLKEEKEKKE